MPDVDYDQRAKDAHQAYMAVRRFGSLDGLRFLCIAGVLWHHGPLRNNSPDALVLSDRGNAGVDFFFVLSGYLITTLLLRERKRTGSISLPDFYWRRAVRILPVYYFVIGSVSAYYILVKGVWEYTQLVPFYFLFLANFLTEHIPTLSVTWSLSVEEQYYFLWPLLLVLLPWRWLVVALLFLVAANVSGAIGLLAPFGIRPFEIGILYFRLPSAGLHAGATYAPLLIGSGLALVLHGKTGFGLLYRFLSSKVAAVLWLVVLLLWLNYMTDPFLGLQRFSSHFFMAITLAALVVREDNGLHRILSNRLISHIGAISYGIYLYHLIGLHIANIGLSQLGISDPTIIFVVYLCISIALAELSWRTLESYFLSLRNSPPWNRTKTGSTDPNDTSLNG